MEETQGKSNKLLPFAIAFNVLVYVAFFVFLILFALMYKIPVTDCLKTETTLQPAALLAVAYRYNFFPPTLSNLMVVSFLCSYQ